MIDAIYIVTTVVFFGLMLAYLRGCERLGRRGAETAGERKP
jgi:hypothetical protein